MLVKDIITEDFVNYKLPSMTIEFPFCTFKCGAEFCQNYMISKNNNIDISIDKIVNMFMENQISEAIVMQGLEPFDSWDDLYILISSLRKKTCADIVIYTGYKKDELADKLTKLKTYKNIIIKYGRYIPNRESVFDDVLGVTLSSNNQYAERL